MVPGWIRLYRLIFGLIGALACWRSIEMSGFADSIRYFTNQSGILASTVLLLGAIVFTRIIHGWAWNIVRGVAVIAMLVTGIVYALLLDGLYNPFDGSHGWHQSVLHQLMPIVMLLDILIVPLSRRFPWAAILTFLIYPLAYCGYWMWKGDRDGWYPYDFIDPRTYDNGLTGVFTTVGGLLLLFVVIGLAIVAYSRGARRRMTNATGYSR